MSGQSETKHTPGEIEADDFVVNDGPHGEAIYLRSNVRHWAVCKVMSMAGCSDPAMDVSADEMKANAARIVLTWNCHDDLVAALNLARTALLSSKPTMAHYEEPVARHKAAFDAVETAIAKATTPTP